MHLFQSSSSAIFHWEWLPSIQDKTQKCPLVKWAKWLKNLRHIVWAIHRNTLARKNRRWVQLDFQLKEASWCTAIYCWESTDSSKPLHSWNKYNLQESAEKEEKLCWSNISWWLITTVKLMPPHVQTECNQSIIRSCQTHSYRVEISLLETDGRNCSLYSEWSTNKTW